MLVKNGCMAVSEGANMPTDLEGVHVFKAAKILYAPSKTANAGGVVVSDLEMSQNSARIPWKEAEPTALGCANLVLRGGTIRVVERITW